MKDKYRFYHKAKLITYVAAFILFTAAFGGMLWAQNSFWEGKLSTAPYGLLPNSGMYAASNAFPLDTKVVITHPSKGTQIEVRIVARVDRDRVFMQVSQDAAQELGITDDEILTVEVSPVEKEEDLLESSIAGDQPFSRDPDINPSAAVQEDSLALVDEYLAEETADEKTTPELPELPEQPKQQPEQPAVTRTDDSAKESPAQETPDEKGPAEAEFLQVEDLPEREQPLAEVTVDLPAPSLEPQPAKPEFQPEKPEEIAEEKSKGKDQSPEPPELEGPFVAELEPLFIQEKDRRYSPNAPELPESTEVAEGPQATLENAAPSEAPYTAELEVRHSPEPIKEDAPKADIASTVEEEEKKEGSEVAHSPILPVEREDETEGEMGEDKVVEIPEDAELVLVPAEERPPEGPVTAKGEEPREKPLEPPEEESKDKEAPQERVTQEKAPQEEALVPDTSVTDIPVQRNIDAESYYLQVAAYSKLDLAQTRGRRLASRYPVTLFLEEKNTAAPYKLMIGPLNEHESGTLLFTFTSRGYRDAFIRKGN